MVDYGRCDDKPLQPTLEVLKRTLRMCTCSIERSTTHMYPRTEHSDPSAPLLWPPAKSSAVLYRHVDLSTCPLLDSNQCPHTQYTHKYTHQSHMTFGSYIKSPLLCKSAAGQLQVQGFGRHLRCTSTIKLPQALTVRLTISSTVAALRYCRP